jgi:hypothetical protein
MTIDEETDILSWLVSKMQSIYQNRSTKLS